MALGFFTRIPMPKSVTYSAEKLNQASRYFSLVGICLALILSVFTYAFSDVFPSMVMVLLLMTLSLLLSGAFHEDGLADMADGIGGGFTVSKRLEIMKDSRLGTYGTVTLVTVLALKASLLFTLFELFINNQQDFVSFSFVLLTGYATSRAVAGSLIYDMNYVSEDATSKSKPLANKQSDSELALLLAIGILPLLYFSFYAVLTCLLVLIVFRILFKSWLNKRLRGYTGDCLGAAQQLAEILIYLVLVAHLVQ